MSEGTLHYEKANTLGRISEAFTEKDASFDDILKYYEWLSVSVGYSKGYSVGKRLLSLLTQDGRNTAIEALYLRHYKGVVQSISKLTRRTTYGGRDIFNTYADMEQAWTLDRITSLAGKSLLHYQGGLFMDTAWVNHGEVPEFLENQNVFQIV